MEKFKREHGKMGVVLCPTPEATADGCDALVLVTEWNDYRDLDWEAVGKSMRSPFILDGRHSLDSEKLIRAGFRYAKLG
jgi:UDPglucose 6-dehydrogenase